MPRYIRDGYPMGSLAQGVCNDVVKKPGGRFAIWSPAPPMLAAGKGDSPNNVTFIAHACDLQRVSRSVAKCAARR
jgi:hypothetical protein